jgi:hypothetical protein
MPGENAEPFVQFRILRGIAISSLIDEHTPFSKVSGIHALAQANTASCGLGALSKRGIAHRQT